MLTAAHVIFCTICTTAYLYGAHNSKLQASTLMVNIKGLSGVYKHLLEQNQDSGIGKFIGSCFTFLSGLLKDSGESTHLVGSRIFSVVI